MTNSTSQGTPGEKRPFLITLNGCDDTTYIREKWTKEEIKTIRKLARLSHKNSSYGCQPVMYVERER